MDLWFMMLWKPHKDLIGSRDYPRNQKLLRYIFFLSSGEWVELVPCREGRWKTAHELEESEVNVELRVEL